MLCLQADDIELPADNLRDREMIADLPMLPTLLVSNARALPILCVGSRVPTAHDHAFEKKHKCVLAKAEALLIL